MVRVDISGDDLLVELSPWEKIWAVHGNLRIPLEHITGVRIEDENGWKRMFAKLIGTNAPPFKISGIFFGNGGLVFCDYENGKDCLVLDTQHERYRSIIIQLTDQDPRTVAQQIESRLKQPQQ